MTSTNTTTKEEMQDMVEKLIATYIDTHFIPRIEALEKQQKDFYATHNEEIQDIVDDIDTHFIPRLEALEKQQKSHSTTHHDDHQSHHQSYSVSFDRTSQMKNTENNRRSLLSFASASVRSSINTLFSIDEETADNSITTEKHLDNEEDKKDYDDDLSSYQDTFNDHEMGTVVETRRKTRRETSNISFTSEDDDIIDVPLNKDSYSIMMVSKPLSIFWWFSLIVFSLQTILFSMVLSEQSYSESYDHIFNLPASVTPSVLIGQFLAIIVLFTIQGKHQQVPTDT